MRFTEPNYIVTASAVPNDPSYSSQWGFAKIQAAKAWDLYTGECISPPITHRLL